LVFAVLVLLWFVRPLRRRVNDMQVALYVEEYDPSLQAAILSAVESAAAGNPALKRFRRSSSIGSWSRRSKVPGPRWRQGRRSSGHSAVRDSR